MMNNAFGEEGRDCLLDQALAEYARVEVPTGLERRILQRVHRPQRLRMAGQTLGGLAALAASALLLLHHSEQHPEQQPDVRPKLQWTQLLVPTRVPERHLQIGRVPYRRINITEPKASVFPIPAPLTSEERALLAMAQNFSSKTVQAIAEFQSSADEPIQIEALKIEPLTIAGENR